jgi:hypothetical protein
VSAAAELKARLAPTIDPTERLSVWQTRSDWDRDVETWLKPKSRELAALLGQLPVPAEVGGDWDRSASLRRWPETRRCAGREPRNACLMAPQRPVSRLPAVYGPPDAHSVRLPCCDAAMPLCRAVATRRSRVSMPLCRAVVPWRRDDAAGL